MCHEHIISQYSPLKMLRGSRKYLRFVLILVLGSCMWIISNLFTAKGGSHTRCNGIQCSGGINGMLTHTEPYKISNTSKVNNVTTEHPTTQIIVDVEARQVERQEHLRNFCGPNKPQYNFGQFHYLIYNDDRKIVYCYVPKVACTQWKRIFMLFDGFKTDNQESIPEGKVHEGYRYKKLKDLPRDAALKRLKEYKKIMFVREPFERIVSAYRDKFMRYNQWFASAYGKAIIRKYRKNATAESLKKGHDVKFDEFFRYVVDGGRDEHWIPQLYLCQPCAVDYDLLGHYETLEEDANLALRITNVTDIKFPKVRYSDTAKYLQEYFSQIPKEHVQRLKNIYQRDYNAFQFETPEVMKTFLN